MKGLETYQSLLEQFPDVPLKGKKNPYTSLNGHMFSFLQKDGRLAFRLSKEDKKAFNESHNPEDVISYNSVMNGYVNIDEAKFEDIEFLKSYFQKSLNFISSLKPKPTKKPK